MVVEAVVVVPVEEDPVEEVPVEEVTGELVVDGAVCRVVVPLPVVVEPGVPPTPSFESDEQLAATTSTTLITTNERHHNCDREDCLTMAERTAADH